MLAEERAVGGRIHRARRTRARKPRAGTLRRRSRTRFASPPPISRKGALRTLLDVIRRALAVKVDVLDPRKQHDLVEQTKLRLQEGTVWYLDDERELTSSVVAWPRSGRKGERRGYFVSSYGAYGQYLRRTLASASAARDMSFGRAETDEAIRIPVPGPQAIRHRRAGSQRGNGRHRGNADTGDDPGYQLNADALRWLPGDGEDRPVGSGPACSTRADCPRR